jgi:hypothetical protein
LFYGPIFASTRPEAPYLPTGSVVTEWDETTWRSKTTADFAAFDLIVIGEDSRGPCAPATAYQAAYDTRSTWTPAVVGRVFVTEQSGGYFAGTGVAGAATYLSTVLKWVASGPGTGLYVAPDCGVRGLDFMNGFGTFYTVSFSDDIVHILDASHPAMAGSSDASLSHWNHSFYGTISSMPSASTWEALEQGSGCCTPQTIAVARNVDCP